MLPPFIIDQIRKREEDVRNEREQPVVHVPIPLVPPREETRDEDADRGVVVIDLFG